MKQKVKKDSMPSAEERRDDLVMQSLDLREISKLSPDEGG